MRNRTALSVSTALALGLAAGSAFAAPFNSPDPRSFAMGGAGVAAGTSANAAFLNPALLAVKHGRDRFSLGLPIIGARMLEQGGVVDAINDFDKANPIGRFEDALNDYDGDVDAARQALIDAGEELIVRFDGISNKVLHVEGNAAAVIGFPGEGLGVSVFANAYVVGGVFGRFSEEDRTLIQGVIAAAEGNDPNIDPVVDDLTSSVHANFAVLTEVGVSLAHKLDMLGGIAIGVTPKLVKVETYNYGFQGNGDEDNGIKGIDDIDIDLDQGKRSDSGFNIDIGVAKDFGNGWRAGLTIKNLIAREYELAETQSPEINSVMSTKLKLEPMARIGVAYQPLGWVTLAADYDLTENEPAGLDSRTQFVGAGVEFDLLRTLQLRFGYRHNLSDLPADIDSGVYSAGIGLSPFGFHFDAAVAGNSDDIGGSLQFGFRF